MKKQFFYLSFVLFLQSSISFGQEIDHTQLYLNNIRILKEAQGESNSHPTDVFGSKYINDEFLPGTLNKSPKVYSFRYNAYQDEIEVKNGSEVYAVIKNFNFPITFLASNKVYQVFEHTIEKEKTKGFFVVLTDAKNIKLLLKEKIKFAPEKKAKSGYHKYEPASFKRFIDTHFIGYKNNKAERLPKKKSDFLELFANNSEHIDKFIKDNKLKYNKTDDLIKIFTYYNSL